MKKLGVAWIISVSAVGSLQDKHRPCDIVLPDQFVDRTKRSLRAHLFWARHCGPHRLCRAGLPGIARRCFSKAARAEGARVHNGGTYVNMEGPAFSTRAESLTNHRQGWDVIGMTNLGEAKCAREAQIAYATMAMVTDYDCWKADEAHVTVEMIIANLLKNAEPGQGHHRPRPARKFPPQPGCSCHRALRNAIMTDKKLWPAKTRAELKWLLGDSR